ncbi:hypothetical protein [Paenibacillus sp. FJAT-26967]|uniref:hypothetical protein n=1 Tax=Paenibacillus sp. FJAT-26967 TaxID=1729690 RepID=UPI0015600B4C|nr:hypothetical protein [Paenibacillus sp. FJAT-26967]
MKKQAVAVVRAGLKCQNLIATSAKTLAREYAKPIIQSPRFPSELMHSFKAAIVSI